MLKLKTIALSLASALTLATSPAMANDDYRTIDQSAAAPQTHPDPIPKNPYKPDNGPRFAVGVSAGPGTMGPNFSFRAGEKAWFTLSVIPIISPEFTLLHGGLRATQDLTQRNNIALYLVEAVGATYFSDLGSIASAGLGVGLRTDPDMLSGASLWGEVRLTGFVSTFGNPVLLPIPAAGVGWYF